ncbi:hypothetical protein JNK13_08350 [bacterium]|nr:hypothetical protein [bacterium]
MGTKYFLRSLLILSFFALGMPANDLVAEELININGVDFPCANCRNKDTFSCEINLNGEAWALSCNEAFDKLLSATPIEQLKVDQLKNYLLGAKVESSRAQAVITKLLITELGAKSVTDSIKRLLSIYEDQISASLENTQTIDTNFLKALWPYVRSGESLVRAKMRRAIIERDPVGRDRDIIGLLNAHEYDKAEEELAQIKSPFASGILNQIRNCREILETEKFPVACNEAAIMQQPQEARKFLRQLQLEMLLKRIETKKLPAPQLLQWVAESSFLRFPFDRIAEATQKALSIVATPTGIGAVPNTPEINQLIVKLSGSFPEDVARYYIARAEQFLAAGNRAECDRLINDSFILYPADIASRLELITKIREVYDKKDLIEQIAEVVPSAFYLFPVLLTLIGLLGAMIKKRIDTENFERESINALLSADDRMELRIALSYFRLPAYASEVELKRKYHQLARLEHPDTKQHAPKQLGNKTHEFSELTQHYNRAREIMKKRTVEVSQ